MKIIIIVVLAVLLAVTSILYLLMRKKMLRDQRGIWKQFIKNDRIIKVLDCWLELKKKEIGIDSIILSNGFSHVAVYGYGVLGKRMCVELENTDVKIDYVIDRKFCGKGDGIRIISPDDTLDETQLVVITAIGDYFDIRNNLKSKLNCPIISLEDVIYGSR